MGINNCLVKMGDGRVFSLGGYPANSEIRIYNRQAKKFEILTSILPDGGRSSFACGVFNEKIWLCNKTLIYN